MKKIVIYFISAFMVLVNTGYSQQTSLPKDFDKKVESEYLKVKKNLEVSYEVFKQNYTDAYLTKLKSPIVNKPAAINNSDCGNPGFETGILSTTDWNGYYQKFTQSTFQHTNSSNNLDLGTWIPDLTDLAATSCEFPGWTVNSSGCQVPVTCTAPIESSLSHFNIVSVGNDPIIGSSLQKVRPYSGNTKSLRLGNAFPWGGSQKITKTFTVNTSNQFFSFWYALVLQVPDATSHPAGQEPTFIVQVKENTSGGGIILHNDLVTLSSDNHISAYDPLLIRTTSYLNPCSFIGTRESIAYRPWAFCSFDLSTLNGKNITVELITRDCSPQGHFGYVYLDDFCSKADASNPSGYISLGYKDACGNGRICVDYSLPKTATATGETKLFLSIYQNGSLVTTLNSGATWLSSGTNYCFNITPALLATLTANGHFDYSIKGDFKIGTTSLGSQYIGNAGSGQDLITNNDYAIECVPQCSCGQWGSIGYSINGKADKFLCNNTSKIIEANKGDIFTLAPQYYCVGGTVAQACNAVIKYDVYFPNGGVLLNVNTIKDKILDSCGNIRIVMKPTCSGKDCPPCEFIIHVNCCKCEQNLKPMLVWASGRPDGTADFLNLTCNETYTDKLECYKQYLVYVENPCGENCSPDSVITTVTYPGGATTIGYYLLNSFFSANLPGTYTVSVKIKCNGVWCKECKITFIQTKKCEPPCDNCKVNGQDKIKAGFNTGASTAAVNTFPATTTINAVFGLGGGSDTYTQIRANVIDVQVTSDNPACLQCYNTPNQWGSISGGSLSGFTSAVSTYSGVAIGNLNNNPREIVFNSSTPATIPMATALNVSLTIPGVNPLSCCCIHVSILVKITFRNNRCEECSKIVKISLEECPGAGTQIVPTVDFLTPGHPQYRQHAPLSGDVKLMSNIKINAKSN